MRIVFRYLLYLLVLALIGFAIYVAVADLPAPVRPVEAPAPPPSG